MFRALAQGGADFFFVLDLILTSLLYSFVF